MTFAVIEYEERLGDPKNRYTETVIDTDLEVNAGIIVQFKRDTAQACYNHIVMFFPEITTIYWNVCLTKCTGCVRI